jgi:hypothetical protein
MLHRGLPAAVALAGLLAAGAANADGRYSYSSEPQIRLGIDILWGGHAPVYVAPPVAWHPPRHDHYRGYERGYDRGYDRGYNRAKWRGNGRHKHRHRHGDDCDD